MNIENVIKKIIFENNWLESIDSVSFLAVGEYNENFVIESGWQKYVFRINHGSQIEQVDQIAYEFNVLKALEKSNVTPKPFYFLSDSDLGGVMLMEFLPGEHLNYERDSLKAASIFARIHTEPISEKLLFQEDPIIDIAFESLRLLNRFPEHPLVDVKKRLLAYHETTLKRADAEKDLFYNEDLVIVNSEVNSGNFLISDNSAFLVDWEKAVVSYRYQDLAHFLIPTTTLWKTDFRFSVAQRSAFLKEYFKKLNLNFSLEELDYKCQILEKTIVLRALSWCYMAYFEYTASKRSLQNDKTFIKIKSYLKDIECFLK